MISQIDPFSLRLRKALLPRVNCVWPKPPLISTSVKLKKLQKQLNSKFFTVHSPPRIVKQPPTDEMLFQVAQQSNENDKPFIIECEAEGEPAPR